MWHIPRTLVIQPLTLYQISAHLPSTGGRDVTTCNECRLANRFGYHRITPLSFEERCRRLVRECRVDIVKLGIKLRLAGIIQLGPEDVRHSRYVGHDRVAEARAEDEHRSPSVFIRFATQADLQILDVADIRVAIA